MNFLIDNSWHITYLFAQSSPDNSGGGIGGVINLILVIFGYVFGSYCFQKMLDKLGEPNSWFA